MKSRMNINEAEPRIYKAMLIADKQIKEFDINAMLKELIKIRVSQINGCGYCIDYHSNDALALGESTQRLLALSAWWETPFYSDGERAALKLAEEVTRIYGHGVSDETYEQALKHFGKQGLAQIIFIAITTNSWNRIAIPVHMVAGVD
ncbi:carboxymuconolactone decarboxylase family protein [Mucilaginibacter ginsenosidivorans]|uniref:Carboxymuconolactone decarboxylase family protein n=1 Tax=Mucilaginibacter ginsenosidivorans TaxID=398053 RepID=A0A5B8UX40_9SPHI|nr:carboxymuconolactone decarboxylase family protein [Mucilaginibacter ginsenosidivorans]QEC62956.1 carboxymuconolactone decarboxylase family protein [Mucilaginibacter ginsenosidivorans]